MPLDLTIEATAFLAALLAVRPSSKVWSVRRLPISPVAVAFWATLLLAAVLSAVRPPFADHHDELSYLLAAETYASGRVTNPPHRYWRHFETMHVLQQPTYQSRYPPGQGLALAVGRLLTGRFIAGAWLSMAAGAVALYWCLTPWMPRGWALFGALLPILRFGSLSAWNLYLYGYWTTTYWGGGVAFLGGALALGAGVRLARSPRTLDAIAFAAGLSLMAISRPYEGLVASVPMFAVVLWSALRRRAWTPLAVSAFFLAVTLAGIGYYNRAVTGSALLMPYEAYAEQYDIVRTFRFQPVRPEPEYRHEELRRFHTEFMVDLFEAQRSGLGIDGDDLERLWRFFLGPVLTPFFLLGLLLWRSRWKWFAALLLAQAFAAQALTGMGGFMPHYAAPVAPAMVLLCIQGFRALNTWRRRTDCLGSRLAGAGIFTVAASFLAALVLVSLAPPTQEIGRLKAQVSETLAAANGADLVFVHYSPAHNIHSEWVYNSADIDASPTVWARELSERENEKLIAYFAGRTVWTLYADARPPRLEPYRSRSNR